MPTATHTHAHLFAGLRGRRQRPLAWWWQQSEFLYLIPAHQRASFLTSLPFLCRAGGAPDDVLDLDAQPAKWVYAPLCEPPASRSSLPLSLQRDDQPGAPPRPGADGDRVRPARCDVSKTPPACCAPALYACLSCLQQLPPQPPNMSAHIHVSVSPFAGVAATTTATPSSSTRPPSPTTTSTSTCREGWGLQRERICLYSLLEQF